MTEVTGYDTEGSTFAALEVDSTTNLSGAEEVQLDPPVPAHLGADLPEPVRNELHTLLLHAPGQLSSVYRAVVAHPGMGPTELLEFTDCANAGALGNRRVIIDAVMQGTQLTSPTRAHQGAGSVRKLLKQAQSAATQAHLVSVITNMELAAGDAKAVEEENEQLAEDSAALADALKTASGVYVYTYPHYWRHPFIPDSERRMLKVGRTGNAAWGRIHSQAKQTGMPEDPLLLRVYKTSDPQAAEKTFHMLLDAAEHDRSVGKAVGTEWFVTTLEFCDAVAAALKLEVLKGVADQGD